VRRGYCPAIGHSLSSVPLIIKRTKEMTYQDWKEFFILTFLLFGVPIIGITVLLSKWFWGSGKEKPHSDEKEAAKCRHGAPADMLCWQCPIEGPESVPASDTLGQLHRLVEQGDGPKVIELYDELRKRNPCTCSCRECRSNHVKVVAEVAIAHLTRTSQTAKLQEAPEKQTSSRRMVIQPNTRYGVDGLPKAQMLRTDTSTSPGPSGKGISVCPASGKGTFPFPRHAQGSRADCLGCLSRE
jgi:hypothetical protein